MVFFVFCVIRIAALALRIAWACHKRNVRLGIAAQIFTAAGVLVLFVSNLAFALRFVRAYHPSLGWKQWVKCVFGVLFASAVTVLAMVITVTVQGFFVKEGSSVKEIDRKIQLVCGTYLAAYAFLPVPIAVGAALWPKRTRIDPFGQGQLRTNLGLLTTGALLLTAGATFRAVVTFLQRPIRDPGWFHSRACFYIFNFTIELLVVYLYTLARFDKRFHIRDGSSAPGHYSCVDLKQRDMTALAEAMSAANERIEDNEGDRKSDSRWRIGSRPKSANDSYVARPVEMSNQERDADLAWLACALVCFEYEKFRPFLPPLSRIAVDCSQQNILYGEELDKQAS